MKEFKLIYEEVIEHEFYLDAENLDSVGDAFYKEVEENGLDFTGGNPTLTHIVRVEDPETNLGRKLDDTYGDLEEKVQILEREAKKTKTFIIFASETYCRIVSSSFLKEFKDMATGGMICDIEVMLSVMRDIKNKCDESGYKAVFKIY